MNCFFFSFTHTDAHAVGAETYLTLTEKNTVSADWDLVCLQEDDQMVV